MTTPLWQTAAAFAARAHQHQIRKTEGTPYVSHCTRVAMTVVCLFQHNDEKTLAAALLHDTIEDTNCDYEDIEEAFGREVADIVVALTKDMRLPEEQREKTYDEQLAAAPWEARLVKLADVYDNLCDIWDDASLRKQLLKVDRALKLAEGDSRLTLASNIVRDAAERIRKSMQ